MNVEIINIGDELLIGQVVNTNAAWMAEQLNLHGFPVIRISVVSDDRDHILNALAEAESRSGVVLISGGIGPTKDDITKTTLCEFFGTRLIFNEEAFHDIEILFRRRGFNVTELNRKQADLPENCIAIPNKLGTARGMWFEKDRAEGGKTLFISLPGVPFEMKAMMTDEVIPRLKKVIRPQSIYHKTILTQGIGESFLAALIGAWETFLPSHIRLAYLPQPGIVRLRLTGTGVDGLLLRRQIKAEVAKLEKIIPEYIFGYDEETLEEIVGSLLKAAGATLSTAESCTGGYIAHLLTRIPGSSAYFKGSVVAYANELKEEILGVRPETLSEHGAVSEQVVLEMAAGAQRLLKTDYVIAVSGIAGPDGGTAEKPPGTTWIAVAGTDGAFAKHYLFGDNRERNIRRTALQALNMLRKAILPGK